MHIMRLMLQGRLQQQVEEIQQTVQLVKGPYAVRHQLQDGQLTCQASALHCQQTYRTKVQHRALKEAVK